MKKINKRIPGILPPPPRNEIDGKITDLSAKTYTELIELRDRQKKLLNNHSFVSKLPDKGAKIQAFYDKIIANLNAKREVEQTCRMLDSLKLSEDSVQQVEWTGTINNTQKRYLDSDDDSEPEDVMEIISQCTALQKVVKHIEPEKLLVTPHDLLSIGDIPHVKYIVDKTEKVSTKPKTTGNYKPFKTTKSDVHNPEKELQRNSKLKKWEVTAATPPPIKHGPARILTIEESLKLQKDYNKHLKEIEAKHAADKLLTRVGIKMADMPNDTTKFGTYREADSDDTHESDPEGSDKEVHDEEPERGGVVFTVMK